MRVPQSCDDAEGKQTKRISSPRTIDFSHYHNSSKISSCITLGVEVTSKAFTSRIAHFPFVAQDLSAGWKYTIASFGFSQKHHSALAFWIIFPVPSAMTGCGWWAGETINLINTMREEFNFSGGAFSALNFNCYPGKWVGIGCIRERTDQGIVWLELLSGGLFQLTCSSDCRFIGELAGALSLGKNIWKKMYPLVGNCIAVTVLYPSKDPFIRRIKTLSYVCE